MAEALGSLRRHWPEYLMEAWGLGMFMISAGLFATLLEYPGSPVQQAIADPTVRRVLMGSAMGLTAMAIIYSPWGQTSGAHINPAVTLTFLRLGKVAKWDAVFYIIAQFVGGTLGIVLVALVLRNAFTDPPITYLMTRPGELGKWVAIAVEFAMAMTLMLVILFVSNTQRMAACCRAPAGSIPRSPSMRGGCGLASIWRVREPRTGSDNNPNDRLPGGIHHGLLVLLLTLSAAALQ